MGGVHLSVYQILLDELDCNVEINVDINYLIVFRRNFGKVEETEFTYLNLDH